MKRDMDLVRDLLLQIEREGEPALPLLPEIEGTTKLTVAYHIRMLIEAGLLTAIDAGDLGGEDYMEMAITWQGHEFLKKIRDPEIWSSTKDGAKKVGSWSVGVIGELAKAALIAKAHSLGIPIGAA